MRARTPAEIEMIVVLVKIVFEENERSTGRDHETARGKTAASRETEAIDAKTETETIRVRESIEIKRIENETVRGIEVAAEAVTDTDHDEVSQRRFFKFLILQSENQTV